LQPPPEADPSLLNPWRGLGEKNLFGKTAKNVGVTILKPDRPKIRFPVIQEALHANF
jgi:hypothetical protein